MWLFRRLTDDLVYFSQGADLDADTRARLAARAVTVVDTSVAAVESKGSAITGVRLTDGRVVAREVLAVVSALAARLNGVADLDLPTTAALRGARSRGSRRASAVLDESRRTGS